MSNKIISNKDIKLVSYLAESIKEGRNSSNKDIERVLTLGLSISPLAKDLKQIYMDIPVEDFEVYGVREIFKVLKTFTPSQHYGIKYEKFVTNYYQGNSLNNDYCGDFERDGSVYEIKSGIRDFGKCNILHIRFYENIDYFIIIISAMDREFSTVMYEIPYQDLWDLMAANFGKVSSTHNKSPDSLEEAKRLERELSFTLTPKILEVLDKGYLVRKW